MMHLALWLICTSGVLLAYASCLLWVDRMRPCEPDCAYCRVERGELVEAAGVAR